MRMSKESEILGVDDAEMGEFAYDYVGLEQELGHSTNLEDHFGAEGGGRVFSVAGDAGAYQLFFNVLDITKQFFRPVTVKEWRLIGDEWASDEFNGRAHNKWARAVWRCWGRISIRI